MRITHHNGTVTNTIGRGIPASFTVGETMAADLEMDLAGTVYAFDVEYAGRA